MYQGTILLTILLLAGVVFEANAGAFEKKQLEQHNYYRSLHGARPLTYSMSLQHAAQKWANHLARTNSIGHSGNGNGENVYQAWGSNGAPSGDAATKEWYGEESNYNYRTGSSSNGREIGHFTQVVWKGTNSFGVAKAISRDGLNVYVVANYSPPGNVRGHYQANVQSK